MAERRCGKHMITILQAQSIHPVLQGLLIFLACTASEKELLRFRFRPVSSGLGEGEEHFHLAK